MRKRRQVRLFGGGEQVVEGGAGIDRGAQHQGVDEHADEPVELTLTAARDRRADGDVVGPGEPGEQCRERGVHHHEFRSARPLGEVGQPAMHLGGHLEGVLRAATGGDGRTRAVRGQVEPIGDARQGIAPVRDLRRGHRIGIVLVAEHFPLPQRVVGVLHWQRRQGGRGAVAPRQERAEQITQERRYRGAVGGDVVHDHHDHVLAGRQLGQRDAQRHRRGDIESGQREPAQPVHQLVLGQRLRRQVRNSLCGREYHLVAGAIDGGIHGAQRLVPFDHIGDRGLQRRHIQRPGQPNGERNVVRRRRGVELVQEPHPLLCQRQRNMLRPLHRRERTPVIGALQWLQPLGKPGDRRRFEDQPRWHPRRDGRTEPGGHLRRDQ
ncbi:hypothetical protein GCM10023319_25460 [Nocardia iowensis]